MVRRYMTTILGEYFRPRLTDPCCAGICSTFDPPSPSLIHPSNPPIFYLPLHYLSNYTIHLTSSLSLVEHCALTLFTSRPLIRERLDYSLRPCLVGFLRSPLSSCFLVAAGRLLHTSKPSLSPDSRFVPVPVPSYIYVLTLTLSPSLYIIYLYILSVLVTSQPRPSPTSLTRPTALIGRQPTPCNAAA